MTQGMWTAAWAVAGAMVATGAGAASVDWQTIANPGPVIGADGLPHQATCSGYPGTDPRFRFWVRPGDPKKLAVIFDGGGACWDDLTCSNPFGTGRRDPLLQFYSASIPAGVDPSQYGGLLELGNSANPIGDWTLVAVPYCTGDVHIGSTDRTYQRVARPGLPRNESFTLHHRGYDNFMVVLDWISRNVPQGVTDLLVTGASAGGYGATVHFPWLARQYPNARMAMLADASQGVSTVDFDQRGRASWNPQAAPWVFGSDPLAVPTNEFLHRTAQAYPAARFAQYTTTMDEVQSGFYGYMKTFYGPGGACGGIVPDWNNQMLAALATDRAGLPNFRSYVLAGTSHTIIADSAFYDATPAGISMAAWTGAMLSPGPAPSAWSNAACPDCLVPLRCRQP